MSGAAYSKSGTRYDPVMRRPAAILAVALCLACENKKPPTPTPTPNGVENIRGTERIGWDQQAADAAELATFRFAIYLDSARSEAADVRCETAAGANSFPCSSRLPSMTPGSHTLELAAFVLDGSTVVESARSSPLRVNVSSPLTAGPTASLAAAAITTRDGIRLRADIVEQDVSEPVDLAFDSQGRLFVAERQGVVRVVDSRQPAGGQQNTEIAQAEALLSLALDSDFERTHFVYVVHTTATRDGSDGPVFRLSRYREAGGRLGERAVLVDGVPARRARPSAVVRVAPDGKLHVAFDDGGDPRSAGSAASLNGKLLRLNADGTTPDDQALANPVHLGAFRSPRGLAIIGERSLWIADGDPARPERLVAAAVEPTRPRRAAVRSTYALAEGSDPGTTVLYRGDLVPEFRGDLLVAAGGGHILRVRIDPRSPSRVVASEKLLEGVVDSVRALAVREDGTIYFATPSAIAQLMPWRD